MVNSATHVDVTAARSWVCLSQTGYKDLHNAQLFV